MKKILAFLAVALLAMPLAASAWTPDGDVTVIVAYKAGSGTDTGARLLASQAEKYVGKTLIINNLPGGDGKIGWTELVNAKPDGRTIGFINLPPSPPWPCSPVPPLPSAMWCPSATS